MGLDEGESITDIRKATMRQNAKQMGKQFLLSDREIEVLALYAMGWTQKRVAEELYISPAPRTRISNVSTRKPAYTRAKRFSTSWTSTRHKASASRRLACNTASCLVASRIEAWRREPIAAYSRKTWGRAKARPQIDSAEGASLPLP